MIYLDYNATTPLDERVLAAMMPYLTQKFGNAGSNTHSWGWEAAEAVKLARRQVADAIHSDESEIVFTSGATEAINLAIKGVAEMYETLGNHIITCQTEHKAVLDSCAYLAEKGFEITYLSVDEKGLIDLKELQNALTEKTILVCIMLANNETGVLQPIKEIAEMVHQTQAIMMSDCVQAVGKIAVNVQALGIDLLPISAHKICGPKGVGALYIRRRNPRVRLIPQIQGGGQENNRRSGTLNIPGIVGLGKAIEIAENERENEGKRLELLRDKLVTSHFKVFWQKN
jgi:cysteine desulfurase